MKLFNTWIKPRSASVEELREQFSNAEQAHRDAVSAVESAQTTFDDSGSEAAAKTLSGARDVAKYAEEHLARARRLLDAAERQRAAEERTELQAKRDALATELAAPDAVDAQLVESETKAWLAAVEIRAARHAHYGRRATKWHELEVMSQRLGHAPSASTHIEQPHAHVVARFVREHMERLEMGPVRELAYSVANLLAPNHHLFR